MYAGFWRFFPPPLLCVRKLYLKVGGDICISTPWQQSSNSSNSKVSIVVFFIVLLNTSHPHIAFLDLGAQTSVV